MGFVMAFSYPMHTFKEATRGGSPTKEAMEGREYMKTGEPVNWSSPP
jgi:hypothetical protein